MGFEGPNVYLNTNLFFKIIIGEKLKSVCWSSFRSMTYKISLQNNLDFRSFIIRVCEHIILTPLVIKVFQIDFIKKLNIFTKLLSE